MNTSELDRESLYCPNCRSPLRVLADRLACPKNSCASIYPIINGIPILISDSRSVFSISDFLENRPTTFARRSRLTALIRRRLPSISLNVHASANYVHFAQLLRSAVNRPRVLIVGGSILGEGIQGIWSDASVDCISTDVAFGPHTQLVCDAHDLPFGDERFDGVVIQAVLEHVVDPYRCVAEIHRVLRPGGIVFAETPFMQQVHLGRYDFTRFTFLGHRRLFRQFAEERSGPTCGPGMALAWAYEYFLLSFFRSASLRAFAKVFARATSFWLKYCDHYLIDKPGSFDSASAFYFIGRKTRDLLSDRELLSLYRGAQS